MEVKASGVEVVFHRVEEVRAEEIEVSLGVTGESHKVEGEVVVTLAVLSLNKVG